LRQAAELRVVLKRDDTYALLLRASVQNEDLYCSIHENDQWEMLRSSYHRTGARHTYVDDRRYRIIDPPTRRLVDFRGIERLWGASMEPESLSWTYRSKPESTKRRNLILDLETAPELWCVDLWLVEKDRPDLANTVLGSYTDERKIVSYVKIDWTTPWIYAITWGVTDDTRQAMYDALPQHLSGGRFVSIATGGPPPKAPRRRVTFPYIGKPNRPSKQD
jgi:hypothetical protein